MKITHKPHKPSLIGAVLAFAALMLPACSGGGAGSASSSSCGAYQAGSTPTIAVPSSAPLSNETLIFSQSQFCQDISVTSTPSVPADGGSIGLASNQSVVAVIEMNISGPIRNVPTISATLPTSLLKGYSFAVYSHYSINNGGWINYEYAQGAIVGQTLTFAPENVETQPSQNYYAIVSQPLSP